MYFFEKEIPEKGWTVQLRISRQTREISALLDVLYRSGKNNYILFQVLNNFNVQLPR
jgi:uncharacterized protein YlbG (UPF0298 family)